MGEDQVQEAPEVPSGDPVPWVEYRHRYDGFRKAHVVTRRGGPGLSAPSWEYVADVDFLTVSAPARQAGQVAVEMVQLLNGQRTPEQIPPS